MQTRGFHAKLGYSEIRFSITLSMRVLLIGQDGRFASILSKLFCGHGNEVNCSSPSQSLIAIARDQPDIVCIDIESTFTLQPFFLQLQKLYINPTSGGYYPITIGMIPHAERTNKIDDFLNLGFDLVFEKPIQEKLLFSQIKALDRRLSIGKDVLISPHLLLNTRTHDCHVKTTHGTLLNHFRVTPLQFILLKILISYPRAIWSRLELSKRISDEIRDTSPRIPDVRTIDRSVHKIRKHIGAELAALNPTAPWSLITGYKFPFIHTQESIGYYFFDALSFSNDAAFSNWGVYPPGDPNSRLYETPCTICQYSHSERTCNACMGNRNMTPLSAKTLLGKHLNSPPTQMNHSGWAIPETHPRQECG